MQMPEFSPHHLMQAIRENEELKKAVDARFKRNAVNVRVHEESTPLKTAVAAFQEKPGKYQFWQICKYGNGFDVVSQFHDAKYIGERAILDNGTQMRPIQLPALVFDPSNLQGNAEVGELPMLDVAAPVPAKTAYTYCTKYLQGISLNQQKISAAARRAFDQRFIRFIEQAKDTGDPRLPYLHPAYHGELEDVARSVGISPLNALGKLIKSGMDIWHRGEGWEPGYNENEKDAIKEVLLTHAPLLAEKRGRAR